MQPQTIELVCTRPSALRRRQHRSIRGTTSVRGHSVAYESALERDFLHLISFDRTVEKVAWQPFTLQWTDPTTGKKRAYTPDYLVQHGGEEARTVLVEVKYREDLWTEFWAEGLKARLLAARSVCRERGWTFSVRTELEIRHATATNVTFLRDYMRLDPDPVIEEQLVATLAAIGPSTPRALLAASFWRDDDRAIATPYLWRMIAAGRIECDFEIPLTMSSNISITVGGGYQWPDPYSYRSPRAPASARPGALGKSRATSASTRF